MNKQKFLCFVFAMVLLVLLIADISISQNKQGAEMKLPSGNWSFSAHPYFGSDYQDLPVMVYRVTSEIRAGLGVTKVGIKNSSEKSVTSLKFGWFLTVEGKRDAILQQGQTPLLGLQSELTPDSTRVLIYPVVSLVGINKPLLKGGLLNGDYELEIVVAEVNYSDGSSWKRGQEQVRARSKARFVQTSFAQCPKQKCKTSVAGSAETTYYSCEASQFNEVCSVGSNARSCTVTACGFGGGGGGGDDREEYPILIG